MKKKLRILLAWILVALVFQLGGYSLLNNQLQKVMGPSGVDREPPITPQLKATIPGSDLTNIQVSYAKDYLAYSENATLKIFNLKKGNVVFEKKSPSSTDKTLGGLTYQWLPDRNILLYFYAKKNPNEVTTVKVYPPKLKMSPTVEPQAEDPIHPKIVPKEVPVEPRLEKRYGSPQITELYSLELPNSDEDTKPEDSLNTFDPPSGGEKISEGGKIEQFIVATSTNLMYLTVKKGSTQLLMKIDVMKEVSTLNKPGELIDNMATSDRYGTLYFDSIVGTNHQVIALEGTNRRIISDNFDDRILGISKGKVYIGQVENNQLVNIKTTTDLIKLTNNPSLKTEWEGSIPFNDDVRWLIGAKGQIVIYDHKTANIITAGKLAEVKLQGDENYVSVDGAELIQLTKQGSSTLVELHPLKP